MVSRLVSPRCRGFVGVDFIPGMMMDIQRDAVRSAAGKPASLMAGDGRSLPFRSRVFTKAYCSGVLHTLPSHADGLRMVEELVRVCQPGETFDTLQALRQARASGARTAAIVNVPGSSMTREAEFVIQQNSGPEICVISTKAAMAQMVLLIRLALELSYLKRHAYGTRCLRRFQDLAYLPRLVETTLETQKERVRELAARYHTLRNWFFLGRGIYTPIALESALKMKEVTYLHAEGMAAGFLKHGTLSLIQEDTPCVFLIPPREEKELYDLTMGSVEEVRARKGKVIALTFESGRDRFDEEVVLPKASTWVAPILQLSVSQLLAYETAVILGRNVDRPRALAKSATVS
jgi:glucosamine--fructose-6-phosphate aminotransferase (isomerizing)